MIYPKSKRVPVLATGADIPLSPEQMSAQQSQQKAVQGLDTFANAAAAVPVYGTIISGVTKAAIGLDKGLSSATKKADGTYKNAFAGAVDKQFNPLGTFKAITSGKPKEMLRSVFQHSTLGLGEVIAPNLFGKSPAQLMAERAARIRGQQAIDASNVASQQAYSDLPSQRTATYAELGAKLGRGVYPRFRQGGNLRHALILGGNHHSGGGNAVVNADTGEKLAETEREELLFTLEQTEAIEHLVEICQHSPGGFLELGKLVRDIIRNDAKDHSGKYPELIRP